MPHVNYACLLQQLHTSLPLYIDHRRIPRDSPDWRHHSDGDFNKMFIFLVVMLTSI